MVGKKERIIFESFEQNILEVPQEEIILSSLSGLDNQCGVDNKGDIYKIYNGQKNN